MHSNRCNSYYYCTIKYLYKISGAVLHRLGLYSSRFLELKPEIVYSLGQNEQFFSQLQYLSLDVITDFNIENLATLLSVLAKNATKISSLELEEFYSGYAPQFFHALFHAIINIIKSQEQLRMFSIIGEEFPKVFHGIISALESQKNSLQEIIIERCTYSAEFEVLKRCKNLGTLRIRYCDTELMKLLDYNINTLEVSDCPLDAQIIALNLEKFGILLQRLKFESVDDEIWEESLLLEALKSFCPNITHLDITNIGFSTQFVESIGNLQKLQFLTVRCIIDIPEEELKMRVMQFAEILPLTLQYFELRDAWLDSYVDILLNHCKAPLKQLLIDRLDIEKNSKALIEFCIRNKALNYVGVDRYLNLKDNFRKEIGAYVTLVPREYIIVNC
ncbi:hypothetical protein C2G38_2031024 [Gigaspora rosea]|uniref:F-box domain-containing protein n=1 Tax=Gigaspora rosea TaxID=44941 RepID=A0A397VSG3_9GLOM|nr:hypothetical protein C2G38_2031024 [Gigaspora rosea]